PDRLPLISGWRARRAVLEAWRGTRRALAPCRRRLRRKKEALRLAARFARDRSLDRRERGLGNPSGVEAELFQDVRRLALRQELVRQGDGAHAAGQAMRR